MLHHLRASEAFLTWAPRNPRDPMGSSARFMFYENRFNHPPFSHDVCRRAQVGGSAFALAAMESGVSLNRGVVLLLRNKMTNESIRMCWGKKSVIAKIISTADPFESINGSTGFLTISLTEIL